MRADQRVCSVRQWPGMRSEYSWLPPAEEVTTTRPYQIGVSFSEHAKVAYEIDGMARRLSIPAGAVFANGAQEVRWWEVREPIEALEIYPDLDALAVATAAPHPGAVEMAPVSGIRDATVLGIAAVVKRTHLERLEFDPMHVGALADRLLTHLADHYCQPRPRRRRPGRLDPALLERVTRYVEERIGQPLRLEDLAREARLSPYHFARAFKRSTGLAPHEFVTMLRLERAKTLLLRSHRSVAEIAATVGYANVGHFRRLLRRHTGFTPAGLRLR